MTNHKDTINTKSYTLDPGIIGADFPILSTKINGKPLRYLDSAASAQKPTAVINRMTQFYLHEYANVHRGIHHLSDIATNAYEKARIGICGFLNAAKPEEIVFTKSVTESLNLVASGLSHNLLPGDEIVLSLLEHHSNIVPWYFIKERKGIIIKWVQVADDGSFDFEHFSSLLTDRTKIVAISHMSNVIGVPTPIKAIASAAHSVGALVVVDGAQGAVHGPVDVQELDVDFYGLTGHKLYGPTGIGVLYGKYHLLEEMPPFLGGGGMITDVTTDNVIYEKPPLRFEAGTPPIVESVGLLEAINYINSLGWTAIQKHEADLGLYARTKLQETFDDWITIYGNSPQGGPIISFNARGVHADDIAIILNNHGIAIRAGTHCALPLLTRFGVRSSCRVSFGLYNTQEDVDALIMGIASAKRICSQ